MVRKPANPTRKGYKFVNWEVNGKAYDFKSIVNSNLTLTAKWKKNQEVSSGNTTTGTNTGGNNTTACTPKKFKNKYSYVYEAYDVCQSRGNKDFLDVSDNIDSGIFAYNCEKIVDDCGKTWYGVVFYKWSDEDKEHKVYY